MPTRTLGNEGGELEGPTSIGEGNECQRGRWVLKGVKPERESPKRTISANGGLGPLQMVSEPDTKRCAREEVETQRGWTRISVPARMLGLEEEWTRVGVPAKTLCPKGEWTRVGVPAKTLGPKREWTRVSVPARKLGLEGRWT